MTSGAALFATYQVQQVERQRVEQLATTSEALRLSNRPVESLIQAIAAIGVSKSAFVQFPDHPPFPSTYESLLSSVQDNLERN